jgi:hypothetical protein
LDATPEAEVTDITHALEALTVTASPSAFEGVVDIFTAAGEEAEMLATWTFTRDGTVTVTTCVRLADDCAAAGSDTIALAITSPVRMRRIPAIYRASRIEELGAQRSGDFLDEAQYVPRSVTAL